MAPKYYTKLAGAQEGTPVPGGAPRPTGTPSPDAGIPVAVPTPSAGASGTTGGGWGWSPFRVFLPDRGVNQPGAGASGTTGAPHGYIPGTTIPSTGDPMLDALFAKWFGPEETGAAAGPALAMIPSQVVAPPAIDLLSEMRQRREGQRSSDIERLLALVQIVASMPPAGRKYRFGYEPGGIMDSMLSIITGKPTKEVSKLIPEAERLAQYVGIPVPQEVREPTVQEEQEAAMQVAQTILESLKTVETGRVVAY